MMTLCAVAVGVAFPVAPLNAGRSIVAGRRIATAPRRVMMSMSDEVRDTMTIPNVCGLY